MDSWPLLNSDSFHTWYITKLYACSNHNYDTEAKCPKENAL